EPTAEPTGAAEPTPTEVAEPTAEPTPTKAPQAYLDVAFDAYWDNSYSDDDKVELIRTRYNLIDLRTLEYPLLTDAVNKFNESYLTFVQSYIEELEEFAIYNYQEYGEELYLGPFAYESDMFVRRADEMVLSVGEYVHSYEGGVHGLDFFNAYNFDVQTGKPILLTDVIVDMSDLADILAAEMLEKYPDLMYWTETLQEEFVEYITPGDTEYRLEFTWTLEYDGVTFYFSSYEIGNYAQGTQQVTILYQEYPQIFSDFYFGETEEDYVRKAVGDNGCLSIDLDADGVTDHISISRNYSVETDCYESYEVTVNGNTYLQDVFNYSLEVYLVKSGGNHYLYVQRMVENDYQIVSVFKITADSVEFVDEFGGGLISFINPRDFKVIKMQDMLSTYPVLAECYVGADGMPVEKDGIYEVQSEIAITSTVEITAELVDEEGLMLGLSYTFPAGTTFTFKKTDGESFIDMLADDGQLCRFETSPGWPPTVNGMNAEEFFEMLWYAG
ncbi:MAG: DUF3298 domain-containing protein, partial [Lachnospiraceae bacterium]|nr:DUF3298 domain-containing protein [Lachnospiraceae bacterium]